MAQLKTIYSVSSIWYRNVSIVSLIIILVAVNKLILISEMH